MPHKVDKAMGTVLRRLRKNAEVTQGVLAERAGLSYPQIQKYESGKNRISISRLFELAEALNTTASKIITLVEFEIEVENF